MCNYLTDERVTSTQGLSCGMIINNLMKDDQLSHFHPQFCLNFFEQDLLEFTKYRTAMY